VKEKKRTRRKTTTNDENAINILIVVQLNPTSSIRQLEREYEPSRRSILRILHENILSISHLLHQNL